MIDREALKDNDRLLRLYHGARSRGIIGRSTADLVNYFAAAEEALMNSTGNPGDLFVWLVTGRRWDSIDEYAEDRAVDRLKGILGRSRHAAV